MRGYSKLDHPVNIAQDELWRGFLQEASTALLPSAINAFQGKRVLITGAGGYIGSAVSRTLATFDIDSLLLLENNEYGLYSLDRDLRQNKKAVHVELILGSVCDRALLQELFDRHAPQMIIHTAALKHVPLLESNPFAAFETNVLGTSNLIEVAVQCNAEQMIHLSTDKAVDPINIMGASKRVAEFIALAQAVDTQIKVVRFCNVLGSSGSVAPLFLQQIQADVPLTITSREATRYFISVDEAVSLLLSAATRHFSTGLAVPKVNGSKNILDLAAFLIGKTMSTSSLEDQIVFTGLRPGDKLHERLTSTRERVVEHNEDSFLIDVESPIPNENILLEAMKKLRESVNQRDLAALLRTLQTLVPEYEPSKTVLAAGNIEEVIQ